MAERPYTTPRPSWAPEGAILVVWTGLTGTDTGAPFSAPWMAEVSVQVVRTAGATSTVVWQGTNEPTPTTWVGLSDPQGTAISLTAAAALEQVLEHVAHHRPAMTAGDGTVTVYALFCRTSTRGV